MILPRFTCVSAGSRISKHKHFFSDTSGVCKLSVRWYSKPACTETSLRRRHAKAR